MFTHLRALRARMISSQITSSPREDSALRHHVGRSERGRSMSALGRKIAWLCVSGVSLIGVVSVLKACDSEPAPASVEPADEGRAVFLQSIRQRVITPLTEEFAERSEALRAAVASGDLDESRRAWRDALVTWQRLELLQVGPAGGAEARIGGADLRDHIYSFPTVSPCRVEQEWLAQRFSEASWSSGAAYQVKGLDALELLLFKEGRESSCPEQAQLVRDGEWADFTADDARFEETRWAYAEVISADINERAAQLAEAWRGDFGVAFELAEAPFNAQREAVNQVFAAIFYLDQAVKDFKLGAPTGIYMTCLEETCPELLEHRASSAGREALIANFEGALMILRGGMDMSRALSAVSESPEELLPEDGEAPQLGLRGLLAREGASALGEQLEQLTLEALEQLSASELSLSEQLATDADSLRALHATTRALTELLKSQVVTTLNLSVPREGAGDND